MSEPIIVSNEGPERELPPAGICNAVCAYAVDVGYQDTPYGEKKQVMLGFELEHRMEEGDNKGKRFLLSPLPFTATTHEKGNLAKCLVGWFGRDLTPEENRGFDLSTLVGQGVTVTIAHRVSGAGKKYANINAYAPKMPSAENMVVELEKIPDWVIERKVAGTTPGFSKPSLPEPPESTEIPF